MAQTGMRSTGIPAASAARAGRQVGGEDVVAVGGQARHGGIDCVRLAAMAQQHPAPPARAVINRHQVGPGQQPGQRHLPASAAAQGLGHHSPARHRRPPRQTLPPDQRHNVTIPALCRHERPRLPAPAPRRTPLRRRAAAELAGMGRQSSGLAKADGRPRASKRRANAHERAKLSELRRELTPSLACRPFAVLARIYLIVLPRRYLKGLPKPSGGRRLQMPLV